MGFVRRTVLEFWTKVERVVFDEHGQPQVKETTCCCKAPGSTPRGCAEVTGNKTPCRCDCHRTRAPRTSPPGASA